MAATKYTYSIAADTLNSAVASSRLSQEISSSAIVTAIDHIETSDDILDVWFKDALSAGDETILGGLVAAHTGEPVPFSGRTEDGIDLVTFPQRSADDVPLVAQQQLTLGQAEFLRVDNGSAQMNIDGTPSGTPVVVWNGTGVADTGGDWTAGGTGSETAGSNHSGTNGWDTGVLAANEAVTFDTGSLIDVAASYDQLTFWLQPKAWSAPSRFRVGFLDDSNDIVGSWLRIEDYTTNMDLDTWQKVSIPLDDFNLGAATVQKIRFQARVTNIQQHWLDDIELVPSGGTGPYRFRVAAPDASTRYHVSMVVLVISSPSAGWNPTAFADIAGGLSNGLLLRQRNLSDSEVIWRLNSKDNTDLFGRFHPQDDITFASGDLLVGLMVKPGKASVIVTDNEVLEVVVRDDLSTLSSLRGYVHYGVEVVA